MEMPAAPAPPAPPRRWRLAAAMIALASLTAVAVGSVTLWQKHEQRLALRAAARAAFDLDAVMDLAGAEVPAETDSFYFFVLEPDARGESDELALKLVQAAGEGEILGIAGPDSEHNRAVLRAALARLPSQDLAGLVVVYVGPADHEAELAALVRATGAQCRYVVYTPPQPETI